MIRKIDHFVITTPTPDIIVEFYQRLGFKAREDSDRYELFAGDFKINVQILGKELTPRAKNVQPGSADLCFEILDNVYSFKTELESRGFAIELGVVPRTGSRGAMESVYVRDPDGNLLEFSSYDSDC